MSLGMAHSLASEANLCLEQLIGGVLGVSDDQQRNNLEALLFELFSKKIIKIVRKSICQILLCLFEELFFRSPFENKDSIYGTFLPLTLLL